MSAKATLAAFGFYLLHRPVMYLWQNLIGLGLHLHGTAVFLIVAVTLLVASHVAYRWIEQQRAPRYRVAAQSFPENWPQSLKEAPLKSTPERNEQWPFLALPLA